MPSIAKSAKVSSSLSTRNVLIAAAVVGFTLLLFFLPELFRTGFEYQVPGTEGATAVATKAAPTAIDERSTRSSIRTDRETLGSLAEIEKEVDSTFEQQESPLEITDFATWQGILTKKNSKALANARKEALILARAVPDKYTRSRMALLAFANGLQNVLDRGGKGVIAPDRAIPYLAQLDMIVTETFEEEKVPRGEYLRWFEIRLGPELQSLQALRLRIKTLHPFRPEIRLTKVMLSERRGVATGPGVYSSTTLHLEGIVVGSDVEKFFLMRSDKYGNPKKVRLHGNSAKDGYQRFALRYLRNVQGVVFTFIAEDTLGNKYRKSYNFYPNALKFQHGVPGDAYKYLIPYPDNDPRLDAAFAMTTGSTQQKKFFGGSSVGRF